MSSKEVEQICATLTDVGNQLEAIGVSIKGQVSEIMQVDGLLEKVFKVLLGWEQRNGSKLGEFEVTSRSSNNNSDAYGHAFNVLKANNAAIDKRYHGEGFEFAYWIYVDSIYRKKLKGD